MWYWESPPPGSSPRAPHSPWKLLNTSWHSWACTKLSKWACAGLVEVGEAMETPGRGLWGGAETRGCCKGERKRLQEDGERRKGKGREEGSVVSPGSSGSYPDGLLASLPAAPQTAAIRSTSNEICQVCKSKISSPEPRGACRKLGSLQLSLLNQESPGPTPSLGDRNSYLAFSKALQAGWGNFSDMKKAGCQRNGLTLRYRQGQI